MDDHEHENAVENWRLQLEAELLIDECDFGILRNICKGHVLPESLRKKSWIICLGSNKYQDSLQNWDGMFDLPNQLSLRDLLSSLVEKISLDESQKVILLSDLESVLTFYIKTTHGPKTISQYWSTILSILLPLDFERVNLYNCFSTITNKYLIRDQMVINSELPYDLFRLILLYHEPELCSFLESKKVVPKLYCQSWFKTLFASSNCQLQIVQALWDVYFQHADPFLMFFICLVFIVNAKEALMTMKECDKQEILDSILAIPSSLTVEDVEDICTISQHYASLTPYTTRTEYRHALFQQPPYILTDPFQRPVETVIAPTCQVNLSHALCLTISVDELLRSKANKDSVVTYFVVDCRPAEQYNNGHHPMAFHLDANLMLQDPEKFETAVGALMAAQRNALSINSAAGGKHLCLIGSGRMVEDQYLNMIIANFLRKHHKYVSSLKNGYAGLHDALHDNLDKELTQHNSKYCIMCSSPQESKTGLSPTDHDSKQLDSSFKNTNFLGKFSNVMKLKTIEMKDKLTTYITNNPNSVYNDPLHNRHVTPEDLNAKRYRNMPALFSLADEYDASSDEAPSDQEDHNNSSKGAGEEFYRKKSLEKNKISSSVPGGIQECVSVDSWCNKVDAIGQFECNHFVNGTSLSFPSHLIVSRTHLYILRHLKHHNSTQTKPVPPKFTNRSFTSLEPPVPSLLAYVACTRSLGSVVKITSRKKHPEVITLKYGRVLVAPDSGETINGKTSEESTPEPFGIDKTSSSKSIFDATIEVDCWDKLLIPQAGDATKLIKRLIVEQMERDEQQEQVEDDDSKKDVITVDCKE